MEKFKVAYDGQEWSGTATEIVAQLASNNPLGAQSPEKWKRSVQSRITWSAPADSTDEAFLQFLVGIGIIKIL